MNLVFSFFFRRGEWPARFFFFSSPFDNDDDRQRPRRRHRTTDLSSKRGPRHRSLILQGLPLPESRENKGERWEGRRTIPSGGGGRKKKTPVGDFDSHLLASPETRTSLTRWWTTRWKKDICELCGRGGRRSRQKQQRIKRSSRRRARKMSLPEQKKKREWGTRWRRASKSAFSHTTHPTLSSHHLPLFRLSHSFFNSPTLSKWLTQVSLCPSRGEAARFKRGKARKKGGQ